MIWGYAGKSGLTIADMKKPIAILVAALTLGAAAASAAYTSYGQAFSSGQTTRLAGNSWDDTVTVQPVIHTDGNSWD